MNNNRNYKKTFIVGLICVSMVLTSFLSYAGDSTLASPNQGNETIKVEGDKASDTVNNSEPVKGGSPAVIETKANQGETPLVSPSNEGPTASPLEEGPVAQPTETGTSIKLSMPVVEQVAGQPKMTYLTGESISLYNGLVVSGDTANFPNSYNLIKIPKKYVTEAPIASSGVSLSEAPTVTSNADEWIIKFKYKSVTGGHNTSIPFSFTMNNGKTPDGYQLNVVQEYYAEDNTLLAEATYGPFIGKTTPPIIYQYSVTAMGGYPKPSDPTVIDPDRTRLINHSGYIRNLDTTGNPGNYGSIITTCRVFVQLPEGAVFKAENNPGWNLDPVSKIMYKDLTFTSAGQYQYFAYNLEYPDVKFNTSIPLKTWVSQPDPNGQLPLAPRSTDKQHTGTARLTPTILADAIKSTVANREIFYLDSNRNTATSWIIYPSLQTDEPIYVREIADVPDAATDLSKVSYSVTNPAVVTGANKLYGKNSSNVEVVIAENIAINTEYDVAGYKEIRLVFEDPVKVSKAIGNVSLTVKTTPNQAKWDDKTILGYKYNNGKVSYSETPTGRMATYTARDWMRVSPYNPGYYVSSTIGKANQYVDNIDTYTFNVYIYDTVLAGDKLKNPKIVTLMPSEGVEWVPSTIRWNNKDIMPKYVSNYNGSGRPAVVIEDFGDLEGANRSITGGLKFKFTRETKEGANKFETYVYSETGENNPFRWNNYSADIYDMDGDGNKTERVGYTTKSTNFTPPKELVGSIKVSSDDLNYGRTTDGVDIGGDVFYKLTLDNKMDIAVDKAQVLNVLPRKGDRTIVENTANQFVNRGSQYDVFLTGPVTAPPGFTVTYSTEAPSPGGAMSIKGQTFVPAAGIGSWSDVTMFKIVMDPGVTIAPAKSVDFKYKAKVSSDESLKEGLVANNTQAYSITGNSWSECLAAEAPIVKYHVDGKIFFDKNENGTMDEDDYFLKGYKFKLIHVATGTVYQGVTDSTGAYKATGLKRGDYVVSVDKKPAEAISPLGVDAGDGKIVNQFNNVDSRTNVFNLVPGNNKATKNAGVYREKGSLDIVKTDENGNPLANVVFELLDTVTGDKVTLTTDENGKVSHFGLILDRAYKLTEKSAPAGYYVPAESFDITPTVDLIDIQKNLTNRLVKTNIGVLVHETGKEGTVLPGAKVKLQKLKADGTPDGDPIVLTTNAEGKVLFTDVNYGNYQIIQETTVNGYIINSTPIDISVTTEGQSIQKKIPNDIIKANLTVNVVDKDDNNIKLKGAKVKLQPLDGSGNPLGSPVEETTDANGKVNFNNLPYGNYKVTEVTSPEGYIIDTTPIAVSVTSADPIEKTIENEKIKANLLVNVVDKDNNTIKLEGAKVRLQKLDADGNPTGAPIEVNTDVNGKADFGKVPYGDYRITEVSTAEGYLVDTAPINISVKTNGENIEKTIKNEKIKADITVNVVDKDNNNIKLQGAKVKLQPVDGSGNPIGTAIEATTDANGKVKFDKVPYGNYKITEVTSPEGYVIDNAPIDVAVTTVDPIEKTIQNEKIKSNVTVNVVDKDDNAIKLEGAQVKLQPVDGSGNPVGAALVVSTGADGKANFTNVPYGKYKVVEVATIEGYVLNTTPQDVTVDTPGATIEKTIENEKIKSDIEVTVVDKDNNAIKLEGAKVKLQKVDKDGNPVGEPIEATTDANGQVKFDKVPFGNYKITEVTTIEGYVLNTAPIDVSVKTNGEKIQKTIENEKIKSDVVVNVVDKDDNNIKLEGAKVKLQPVDKDGNPVGTAIESTTDINGQVKFDKVPFGNYKVTEVTTIEGYVLNSAPVDVSVTTPGATIEKTIENEKIKSDIEVTVVDKDNNAIKLEGAKVKLQKVDKDGNPVGDPIEATTDANGQVKFDKVPYGNYKITEVTTIEGYVLNTAPIDVSVKTNGEKIQKTIENEKIKSDVVVNVLDKDDNNIKLEGAKVKLQPVDKDGNPVGTAIESTTDINGQVKFDKVPYGNYKITEVTTIEGYVLNTDPIDISVKTDGEKIEKTIENEKIKSDIEVTVVDKDNNAIKLEGAKVKLQKVDENGKPVGDPIEATTDANGQVKFDKVPYGNYKITEVTTIEGYVLNTAPIDVSVKTNGEKIQKTIENEKIKNDLIVNVLDKDDNTIKLEGAKVKLQMYDGEGNPVGAPIEATTDANGQVKFEKLVYGNYKITEIQTIEGYVLNDGPVDVSVVNNGETQEKTIENEKIKSDIVVNVVDKENKDTKLAGAKVKLQKVDKDGNPVGEPIEATTDANGQVKFEKVPYGEYQVVEVKSSEGYIIDSTPINVSVKNNGETIENTIENAKIKGKVEITVVDKDNHNILLKGAKVKIQRVDKAGNPIGDPIEAISDENGLVVFDNVEYGDYVIAQITSQEGYEISTENQKFSIKTPGEVVKITIENTKIPAISGKVTKTGDTFNYYLPMMLIMAALIAISGLMITSTKRKKN